MLITRGSIDGVRMETSAASLGVCAGTPDGI